MKTRDKEEIREAVRDRYGKVARLGMNEWMPGINPGDYIVSAYIEAKKPE